MSNSNIFESVMVRDSNGSVDVEATCENFRSQLESYLNSSRSLRDDVIELLRIESLGIETIAIKLLKKHGMEVDQLPSFRERVRELVSNDSAFIVQKGRKGVQLA